MAVALEIVVATLGILYSLGDKESEGSDSLIDKIKNNIPKASAISFTPAYTVEVVAPMIKPASIAIIIRTDAGILLGNFINFLSINLTMTVLYQFH